MMSNRNDYRNWTPDEIREDTEATWKRLRLNECLLSDYVHKTTGKPIPMYYLNYENAADRLGLKLVTADTKYVLDAEGNPQLDEKGKPIIESTTLPVHDWSLTVKVEGKTDAYGTPIPKGKQYFVNESQPANRQATDSNREDLASRGDHWVLTGEPLIKDETGGGQNEQHRCMAVITDILTGANKFLPEGMPVVCIDGVSIGAAGAIDTGKKKDAKDDLTSNHEILAPELPYSHADYKGGTKNGYGATQKQARQKILREMQGICKRIALRMSGTNIKGSKFSGYDSNGNVQVMADKWTGLDELVNMAYAYVINIPVKAADNKSQYVRPVKVWEVAVAYAMYCLRQSEALPEVPTSKFSQVLAEYQFPAIDLEPLQNFLTDLEAGAMMSTGPLAKWCRDRVTAERLRDTDESSFAQVCLALQTYLQGEEVPVEINRAERTGKKKENGTSFFHFGGGDRGPLPKKERAKKSEAVEA